MIWKCKDGREIDIREMETSHLNNTIKMLRRKGAVTWEEFSSCMAYACSADTPDGASYAAEQELDSMRPSDSLYLLEEELRKRKTR